MNDDRPHNHDHRHHGHGGLPGGSELAEKLALDALVFRPAFEDASGWVAELSRGDPRVILDLGCGPGIGAVLLARRFEQARVVAVDASAEMLGAMAIATEKAGLADRVQGVLADLDEEWPDLPLADVAWASSMLHESADPAALSARVCRSLAPGGLLMVIEMDGLPTFLPDGAPGSRVEAHARATLLAAGWNSHPDWSRTLDLAGLDVIARRALNPEVPASTAEIARYAERHLGDVREA
ncbi:MAG: hypothetical protein RI885_2624, partial [Actinomycetota bacterium]